MMRARMHAAQWRRRHWGELPNWLNEWRWARTDWQAADDREWGIDLDAESSTRRWLDPRDDLDTISEEKDESDSSSEEPDGGEGRSGSWPNRIIGGRVPAASKVENGVAGGRQMTKAGKKVGGPLLRATSQSVQIFFSH